jgi:predicted enzyme related to lactoylglutathione lyase
MENKNMAKRVIHFEIQADDLKRAKEFYEKVFDWKIEKMMDAGDGGMDYWGVTTGPDGTVGINGGMYQRPKDEKLYTYDCTIQVDDIDKAVEMVKKSGGKIRKEKTEIPNVGWFANCTDPEGNFFGLMQPTGWVPH